MYSQNYEYYLFYISVTMSLLVHSSSVSELFFVNILKHIFIQSLPDACTTINITHSTCPSITDLPFPHGSWGPPQPTPETAVEQFPGRTFPGAVGQRIARCAVWCPDPCCPKSRVPNSQPPLAVGGTTH